MKSFLEIISDDEILPVLDSVKDALFIDDKDGVALWCNKACEELYNIRLDDIAGKHVSELEEIGVFTPSVALLVIKEKKEVTIVHENKDGKRLLSTGTPIFDREGRLTKIVSTSRDITELMTLQNRLDFVQTTLDELKSTEKFHKHGIIADSEVMRNIVLLVKRLADVDTTVLVTGESGVGKGIIAKLLHENGPRKEFPFVKVNCGAIPENLIESELFGYERGAFTGSRGEGKQGLFEAAGNGTIFLDEISELPLNLQVKLLQVIQEKEIVKVGGVKSIPVNVRIISATNKDLHSMVKNGSFREDLYYRLNVIPLLVPPLRERHEDIKPLIRLYLEEYNKKLACRKDIESSALAILLNYDWPGNVRELQNIIERLLITTKTDIILPEHLPGFITESSGQSPARESDVKTLKNAVDNAEREMLLKTYSLCKSTRAVAKLLDISQPTVVRKLRKYGISCDTIKNQ